MSTRAIVSFVPKSPKVGEVVEVRALIAHPMETGMRPGDDGRMVPRNIIANVECRHQGALVMSTNMFTSVAANPYVTAHVRVQAGRNELEWRWVGDNGFSHVEKVTLDVAS